MSIESIAAASMAGAGAGAMPPPETIQAGPGVSISDITGFQGAMSSASGALPASASDALSPAMKAMFSQLEKVNGEAKSVGDYAQAAQASGSEMTPSEIINLTMKCHEFMFHCQLTSNIANRSSDGIQQLFRQQS